ncbi:MAG: bifunctional diaminohydroxyphosphoribosylaminopyrimidine deaminase/5-amino-6-(5-phosphoribosylamino)uracil reductase RibD, partial [Acidobacteria bacterium]|nr:bifunctional diaminohydroxyphosphoribosylaminopyrimidine deaminase/5-amino-6-(5-phosphoribosylamino)uracil reductase RibD [Acidobacteriota bacterium]
MNEASRPSAGHRSDDQWMERALELARQGEALASPNPMVGAALVKNGRVLGEGFHTYDRRRHAEILALEAAGGAARGATLYLNLEPCCHTGRTGRCTEAILAAGVRRVVAAMRDPNPAVAGRGLEQLREAGVEVDTGLREIEAQKLNEAFARWISTGRPLVTLKSALTLDGQIALTKQTGQRPARKTVTWITSAESRAEVQRMRHAADALLTGIGTVLADDPRLTDRTGQPRRRKLLRVVVDSRLRLPRKSKLAKSADGDVLVFTRQSPESPRAQALRKAGVEVVRLRDAI